MFGTTGNVKMQLQTTCQYVGANSCLCATALLQLLFHI
jgi:hypothetical protein